MLASCSPRPSGDAARSPLLGVIAARPELLRLVTCRRALPPVRSGSTALGPVWAENNEPTPLGWSFCPHAAELLPGGFD